MAAGSPVTVDKVKQDPDQQDKGKKRKLSELLEGPVSITVKVGDGDAARTWTLPKDLLTSASTFFDAAFKHSWSESESKSVELKEDNPDAFGFFVRWLYTWALCTDGAYPNKTSPNVYSILALRAWVLGDKLGCPRFQDFAMIHLWRRFFTGKGARLHTLIPAAYAATPSNSALRIMLASFFLGRLMYQEHKFAEGDVWKPVLDGVQDFAKDVVTIHMYKTKPFNFQNHWSDYLLASSFSDFDVKNVD